jgi:hypothetical protein
MNSFGNVRHSSDGVRARGIYDRPAGHVVVVVGQNNTTVLAAAVVISSGAR